MTMRRVVPGLLAAVVCAPTAAIVSKAEATGDAAAGEPRLRPLYRVSLTESGREQDRLIARRRIRTQERIRAELQLFIRPPIS
jgi:hypothetical protein